LYRSIPHERRRERACQRVRSREANGRSPDVLAGAGHMIHHVDPARMVKAIDLIATGAITRASMEAEAVNWGTPA
jgi:hypothetical protein